MALCNVTQLTALSGIYCIAANCGEVTCQIYRLERSLSPGWDGMILAVTVDKL